MTCFNYYKNNGTTELYLNLHQKKLLHTLDLTESTQDVFVLLLQSERLVGIYQAGHDYTQTLKILE